MRPLFQKLSLAMMTLALMVSFINCAQKRFNGDFTFSAESAITSGIPQSLPNGPVSTASINVTQQAVGTVGDSFMGLSLNKASVYEPVYQDPNFTALVARLGPNGVIRIGGTDVDANIYNPNGAGQVHYQIAPSDIDAIASFLNATGWKVIYGVDLTNTATSPTLAAEEIAYAVNAFGSNLLGIEIGNEPDTYPNVSGTTITNFSDFFSRWSTYATAIRHTSPSVALTGPALGNGDLLSTWTKPFAQNAAASGLNISLITQHYYPGFGEASPATSPQTYSSVIDLMNSQVQVSGALDNHTPFVTAASNLAAASASLGIASRYDETNEYIGRPDDLPQGLDNGMASALWTIDHLFHTALSGSSGVNLIAAAANHPSYGPFGFNGGYTSVTSVANGGVRPQYYGMLLFSLAGTGTLLNTSTVSQNVNVTTYTIRSPDGALNVIINNRDPTQNLSFTLNAGRRVSSASLVLLTAPSLTSTAVTLQGMTLAVDGSTPHPPAPYGLPVSGSIVTGYVNAGSAALIKMN